MPIGSAVFMPRGVVHTFRNSGDKPLKMLIHTAPSGFEILFARCAEEYAKPNPPDMRISLKSAPNTGSITQICESAISPAFAKATAWQAA